MKPSWRVFMGWNFTGPLGWPAVIPDDWRQASDEWRIVGLGYGKSAQGATAASVKCIGLSEQGAKKAKAPRPIMVAGPSSGFYLVTVATFRLL